MDASRLHSDTPSALPPGTRLGEFELLSLLGVGGFGIVYLAFDHALEREVAVKEYMPASLAGRTETMHVSLRSQSDAETFALGLKSFVNEARLLARFDHPSLLKVHRFWEGNGTAYMAMPVMRGRTVKEVRLGMATAPDEAWMRALLEPLLGAIEKLHSEGVYHRDIAPDNIQIEPGGHPVLLDFGAARRVIGDKSQMLTAILKPAYAPIEQYAEAGSVRQGPWTDIYALGATLHYVMLGRPPPPATARAIHDDASLLTAEALPGCSENFLRIIDWMLAPRPADRPQSVQAVREALDGTTLPPRRRVIEAPVESHWDRTVVLPAGVVSRPGGLAQGGQDDEATLVMPPSQRRSAQAATPASAAKSAPQPATPSAHAAPAVAQAAQAAASSPAMQPASRSKALPLGLGAAALAAVAVAAAMWWPRAPAPAPLAPELAASAPAAALAGASTPAGATAVVAPTPESAIATVVLPGAGGARGTPTSTTTPTTTTTPAIAAPQTDAKPTTSPVTAVTRQTPVSRPTKTALPAPASAATPVLPTVQAPVEAPPRPVRPQAALPASAPAVAAPLPVPRPVVATGPEATCGGRNPLSYFVCMERECLRSELGAHADCLKWRKAARRE